MRELIGPRKDRKFVFGRGDGFSGFSKAKRQLDDKLRGVAPWRLHDRRTFSTKLHSKPLSVKPHIVEALLNHISGAKASVAGSITMRATMTTRSRCCSAGASKCW
jgi:hypothetical protein